MGIAPLSPPLFIWNHTHLWHSHLPGHVCLNGFNHWPQTSNFTVMWWYHILELIAQWNKADSVTWWFFLHCCEAFIKNLLWSLLLLMQHVLHCWRRAWPTTELIDCGLILAELNLCHHALADGLSTELHQCWLIVNNKVTNTNAASSSGLILSLQDPSQTYAKIGL